MTLLIIGGNGWQRRCDAKCHDAHEPTCECVCGGRFHGKISNSIELQAAQREHFAELMADTIPNATSEEEWYNPAQRELFQPPALKDAEETKYETE